MFDNIFAKCEQHVRLAKKKFLELVFVRRGIYKKKKTHVNQYYVMNLEAFSTEIT